MGMVWEWPGYGISEPKAHGVDLRNSRDNNSPGALVDKVLPRAHQTPKHAQKPEEVRGRPEKAGGWRRRTMVAVSSAIKAGLRERRATTAMRPPGLPRDDHHRHAATEMWRSDELECWAWGHSSCTCGVEPYQASRFLVNRRELLNGCSSMAGAPRN